jgi:hypothetical protein
MNLAISQLMIQCEEVHEAGELSDVVTRPRPGRSRNGGSIPVSAQTGTEPHIQRVTGTLYPGRANWPDREAGHLPRSYAERKNTLNYRPTVTGLPYASIACKERISFLFMLLSDDGSIASSKASSPQSAS